jgi:hypothetical protein
MFIFLVFCVFYMYLVRVRTILDLEAASLLIANAARFAVEILKHELLSGICRVTGGHHQRCRSTEAWSGLGLGLNAAAVLRHTMSKGLHSEYHTTQKLTRDYQRRTPGNGRQW